MTRGATLPLVGVGVWLIGMFLRGPLTWAYGHDTTGKVVDIQPHSRGADGRTYNVTFTYDAPSGSSLIQYGQIDTGAAAPPKVGQNLPIRKWSIGPYSNAELLDDVAKDPSGYICMGLFAAVWCGGVAIGTLVTWLDPMRERRLLRDGSVAEGVVSRKKEARGRGANYQVFYSFSPATGDGQLGRHSVPLEMFERLREGDRVTVVYDPSKPARNGLYEAMDYEVLGAGA